MDALGLLLHDHDVLTSHVEHVAGLVAMVGSRAEPDMGLIGELLRQTELLRDALMQHFGVEEESAFPTLREMMPVLAAEIDMLYSGHDQISEAVAVFERSLRDAKRADRRAEILAGYEGFSTSYHAHVADESRILTKVADAMSPTARWDFAERTKAHL